MNDTGLTHTLTVRVTPSLQADLATASDREGVPCGAIVRRALRAELDASTGRALQPLTEPSAEEAQAHLNEALHALGDETVVESLTFSIGDELADLIGVAIQGLDVIHDGEAPQQFDRAAGYLRQASEHLQRAASRVRALRVRRAIEGGELERLEERIRIDDQAEGHE